MQDHQLTFSNVSAFLKVKSSVIIPYSLQVHKIFKPHMQQALSDSYLSDFHFSKKFFFLSNGTVKGFINHNSCVPCYSCTNKYNTWHTHTDSLKCLRTQNVYQPYTTVHKLQLPGAQATKLCMVAPNMCGFSVWYLLQFTFQCVGFLCDS